MDPRDPADSADSTDSTDSTGPSGPTGGPTGKADRSPAARDPLERLQDALERSTVFPHSYTFKFIVPRAELNHLLGLLDPLPVALRESSGGRYVSVTVEARVKSSEEVIAVYRKTQVVRGIRAF